MFRSCVVIIYLHFYRISLALENWLKWQTNFRIFANRNFMRLSSNNESLKYSWSVWIKKGTDEVFNNKIDFLIFFVLSCKKTLTRSKVVPIIKHILNVNTNVFASVLALYSCKTLCLNSKFLFKHIYDSFILKIFHKSLLNDKDEHVTTL